MNYIIRKPWHLPQRLHTPEGVYRRRELHRREFLASLGRAAAGAGAAVFLAGCNSGTDEEVRRAGQYDGLKTASDGSDAAVVEGRTGPKAGSFPAPPNEQFAYGRPETSEAEAARYTNFYEFTGTK